jgi:hypothetical protein
MLRFVEHSLVHIGLRAFKIPEMVMSTAVVGLVNRLTFL